MGLHFIDVVLSLLAATCGVLSAYFVGHALSAGTGWAWIAAAVLLLFALALGAVTVRRVRRESAR